MTTLLRFEMAEDAFHVFDVAVGQKGGPWEWKARITIESVGFVTTAGQLTGEQAAIIGRERERILTHLAVCFPLPEERDNRLCDDCGGLAHEGECVEVWKADHQARKAATR